MNEQKAIKLENIWRTYQLGKTKLTVLKGIDLEINKGSFTAIMGASGSGKSTLMYIIGCLEAPSQGRVFLEGKDTSRFSGDRMALVRGKKIGFVFQQFNLLPNLNALENVMLPMVFQGLAEQKRKKRAESLLASVNMANRLYHKPSELSGGERQRVAIARALSNDPEIILADEPTGNLDSTTGKLIMEILSKLHKQEQKTIIVVTHDPDIATYSRHLVNIQDGQIVADNFKNKDFLKSRIV